MNSFGIKSWGKQDQSDTRLSLCETIRDYARIKAEYSDEEFLEDKKKALIQ